MTRKQLLDRLQNETLTDDARAALVSQLRGLVWAEILAAKE